MMMEDAGWWRRALPGLLVALTLIPIALFAVLTPEGFFSGSSSVFMAAGIVFALVGSFVAWHRPENPIGWLFSACGVIVGLGGAGYMLAYLTEPDAPDSSIWAWIGSIPISANIGLIVLSFLLFPTGRLPSRRWRPVAWLAVFQMSAGIVGAILAGGFAGTDEEDFVVRSPFPESVEKVGEALSFVFFPLTLGLILSALASQVVRYRRAVGDEREQIRWFAVAAALQTVIVVVPARILPEELALGLLALSFLIMPVVMGVAILRYRLYDIDVVLNRAIVVAALGAFITLVYVAVVVGVGTLLGRRDEPNLALSVAATAVVALAFQPVRERVQRFANRLVYGERATPYEVLSSFLERMHDATPAAELLDRLAQLVSEGTGAVRTQVWLRIADELRVASSWPAASEEAAPLDAVDGDVPPIPRVDRAVPITHHGELLGVLTIVKPRGEAVSPTDEKLVTDVAAQAGLVLRNVRLTAELLDRLEELRASRQRLVSAHDDERRRLERDLHDGAQQQLAAIKIYARMAKDVVEEAGLANATDLLEQIRTFTDEALQALREVAHGIYPPLLASDGLGAALTARTERTPFQVTVDATNIGRYPADVEAAVYFCCLEALQNVAKYAGASAVAVTLAEIDGELTFTVADDGDGFDVRTARRGAGMQNMTDRLDALGGALVISSTPGHGSAVGGRIPIESS